MAGYALNNSWDGGRRPKNGRISVGTQSNSKEYLDPPRAAVRRDPS